MYGNELQREKAYLDSFNEWRVWVIQNKRIPSIHSENEAERKLAARHYYVLKRMKKQNKKYYCYIKEHNTLNKEYKVKKNKTEILSIWLKWCKNHNRLPKTNSVDENEAKVAIHAMSMINRARLHPILNFELISKYESVVESYSKPDTIYNILSEWEEWVNSNQHTPIRHSKDVTEDRLAGKMAAALRRARKKRDKYSTFIMRYEEIYKKYNPGKAIRKSKEETIREWKTWVQENERLPFQYSSNQYEYKLAHRMPSIIENMRTYPQKYAAELEEIEAIIKQYKENTMRENIYNALAEWKAWAKTNGKVPSFTTSDDREKKIAFRLRNNLYRIRIYPEIYENVIKEIKAIEAEYS